MTTETEKPFTGAIFSPCRRFRYRLWRRRGIAEKTLLFIMLNPSTADEYKNDPTVERCRRRAMRMGFGSLEVCNIFAFRATDPKVMKAAYDPIGPENDYYIRAAAGRASMVIAGWGTHGGHLNRGLSVLIMLIADKIDVFHLGLTKGGHPRHPLYVGYDIAPVRWGES